MILIMHVTTIIIITTIVAIFVVIIIILICWYTIGCDRVVWSALCETKSLVPAAGGSPPRLGCTRFGGACLGAMAAAAMVKNADRVGFIDCACMYYVYTMYTIDIVHDVHHMCIYIYIYIKPATRGGPRKRGRSSELRRSRPRPCRRGVPQGSTDFVLLHLL